MGDLDPDAVVLLNKLTWESLPDDFTGSKRRMTTADWSAWIGYEPRSGRITGCENDPPRRPNA